MLSAAPSPAAAQVVPEAAADAARALPEHAIAPGRHRIGRRGRHLNPRKKRSAGRDLRAAIPVGVGLIAVFAGVLFVLPVLFPVLAAVALLLAAVEVIRALENAELRVPEMPVLLGVIGMVVSTAVLGAPGLIAAMLVAVAAVTLWRSVESLGMPAVRDICASVFTLAWVPFLGSFVLLLHQQEFGTVLVLVAILVPVGSDTGGYIAGVLFGKHPMAPRISPKKSWEGFVGSLLCGTGAALLLVSYVIGLPWWLGVIVGAVLVIVATCGDLAQSVLKRDLGIKDMGDILPGHGGVLDRLDSMLLAAPTAYILLEVLA